MSLVKVATVLKLLPDMEQKPLVYQDVKVKLDEDGEVLLPHRGLVEDSEKVKTIHSIIPENQSGVTLTGETWLSLSYDDLVPGEYVVAADDGLQTVYQQDVDYVIRPASGEIRRVSGGAITDGQSVEVYYRRYDTHTKAVDYYIDYAAGKITLIAAGGLLAETTIYVDYQLNYASIVDALIEEAITEAEDKVLARLKPGYTLESTDQGLVTGATELTLSIVCRSLASQALVDGRSAAEGRFRSWHKLAATYSGQSWHTLQPFITVPIITSGKKSSNSSWGWV